MDVTACNVWRGRGCSGERSEWADQFHGKQVSAPNRALTSFSAAGDAHHAHQLLR